MRPTLPPLNPDRTTSGIVVEPGTLERKVPATRRADGSLRKEIRIRPGYTPQEDVSLFKPRAQVQREANALPKGHIPGWGGPRGTPVSSPSRSSGASEGPKTKAQKKNEKRKEKRKEKQADGDGDGEKEVRESWDASGNEDDAEKAQKPDSLQAKPQKEEDKDVEGLTKHMENLKTDEGDS